MDFFLVLIIISAVLGILGYVAWLIFFVWLAKKAISAMGRNLNQTLPNLEQLIQSYSNLPAGRKEQAKTQILNLMTQVNQQMRQLKDIERQRYDVRVGELQGTAASAGFDWTPPSF